MCDADACQLNVRGDGIKPYNLKLDKGHIIGAKPVRLKAGEIVDIGNMRRKQVRKLAYSWALMYKDEALPVHAQQRGGEDADGNKRSKTHELPMSRTTLGRKRPRKMAELIDEWLKGERDSLRIEESSGVSPKGIICIILGIFSLLFCIILGQFADPKPIAQRKKR